MQKIIFLLTVCGTLFYISCKKDNSSNNNPPFQSYIKFKLDNVLTECNTHIKATYLPPAIGPDNIIAISGDWNSGSITLTLNEAQVLKVGTYIFQTSTLRSGEIWTNGPTGRYYSASFGGAFNPSVHGSGNITITEISAEFVKGNFDFVTYPDIATNTFKTVTSGEFHIKRG